MSVDYIVASLPTLRFDEKSPISWEKFCDVVGGEDAARKLTTLPDWVDLETQLKNAMAEARNGARYKRPADGCSLYWKNRLIGCFAEKDILRREEMINRVWWDAAGELTHPSDPLGRGALATYAVRLRIALRRSLISKDAGNSAFDRLTSATKVTF